MTSPFNYESVLHAVSEWPVDRRAMLLHALIDGLKNDATGRRTAMPPTTTPQATATPSRSAQPASPPAAPSAQAQTWADEQIEDRYRRGGRM